MVGSSVTKLFQLVTVVSPRLLVTFLQTMKLNEISRVDVTFSLSLWGCHRFFHSQHIHLRPAKVYHSAIKSEQMSLKSEIAFRRR